MRTEHGAAADPLRRANRALPRAPGALLPPGLLAAASDAFLRPGRVRAGAPGRALLLDDFPEQVLLDVGAKDGIVEVDRADLGAGKV